MLQLLFDFFNGKAKTRIFTTFLGWFLIFHIDILFIATFTDQALIFEKYHQLKGEYVWAYITAHGWWTVLIECGRILAAGVATYLMIWIVPKLISEKSYREELEVEYILRKMKVDKDETLNQREKEAAEQQLENIETEKKAVVERVKLDETPEHIRWDSEFDSFIKVKNGVEALKQVSNTVYAEGGNLYQYKGVDGWAVTPTGIKPNNLAIVDTSGLIVMSDKGKLVTLTDKGKYFIRKLNNL